MPSHGFYFHVGYLLKRKELITDSNHPRLVYGLLLAVIGTVLLSVRGSNIGAALCISLALFIVFYDLRIDNTFLVSCGLSSMVIFVTHQYTRNLMRMVYRYLGWSYSADPALLFVVCSVVCVMFPLLLVKLYKNVRCFRWVEYIFYPGRLILKH